VQTAVRLSAPASAYDEDVQLCTEMMIDQIYEDNHGDLRIRFNQIPFVLQKVAALICIEHIYDCTQRSLLPMMDPATDGEDVMRRYNCIVRELQQNTVNAINASCNAQDLDKALNRPLHYTLSSVLTSKVHTFCEEVGPAERLCNDRTARLGYAVESLVGEPLQENIVMPHAIWRMMRMRT
jgi:hypothetical protein